MASPEAIHLPREMRELRQQRILLEDQLRRLSSLHDGRDVAQLGDPQVGETALAGAEEVARAAQFQIPLGQPEAIVGFGHELQPLAHIWIGRPGDQRTVARLLPTPHTAPELVQLGQTKAIGVLDHHDGGVGHVDADLDDCGAHQYLAFAGGKGAHDLILLAAGHSPVKQSHLQLGEDLFLQALVLRCGGAGVQVFALFHQRVDDVGLAALPQPRGG